MPYLKHSSGGPVELRNSQILGKDSPLEFDEDGYAFVDDPMVASKLLAMHRHIERGGDGPEDADTDAASGDPEAFDAEAFVDRTPMSDVIDDIESGEFDDHLGAIEVAESDGRDRDGVHSAIDARE
ncbi:hypothetical protein [Haloferax sp. ATB1]|uniref:hypothetical protein n=1 Tax=Haloferax sp. ATB1 TaxID=1508454 RepID=UPI0005B205AD|nr:hypothetical protein [Haloferax sp. ATB1]